MVNDKQKEDREAQVNRIYESIGVAIQAMRDFAKVDGLDEEYFNECVGQALVGKFGEYVHTQRRILCGTMETWLEDDFPNVLVLGMPVSRSLKDDEEAKMLQSLLSAFFAGQASIVKMDIDIDG